MIKKFKPADEWLKQAEYDLETAQALFASGRYIYTIFMRHLSIEKGLKGLYALAYNKDAPKTHNLNYLVEKISEHIDIDLSDELDEFLKFLNEKSIPTRCPEDLKIILKDFKKTNTNKILKQTKDLLEWLRLKFKS